MATSDPEAARERDLHRYYRPWLDAQSLVDADGSGKNGLTYAGYSPKAGRDRSLTAFAQLATFRLQVRRAMVSLIDSNRQYILAEATRTLSLFSPTAEKPEDEVWLGNAILNKTDAVCYHTFSSTYTAREEDGGAYTAEGMVIPDCRADPRFADKDYVKGEPGVKFYAGVPIITKLGHRIGVYAVSDEKPRTGISAAELRFMADVAAAVMEHLELAKDSLDRSKGERMVRGLTQFIENSSAYDSREDASDWPSTMERQTENARRKALEKEDMTVIQFAKRQAQRKPEKLSDVTRVFQKAACIMLRSTEADGVVFFDTSAAGIEVHLHETSPTVSSSDESGTYNTSEQDTGDTKATTRGKKPKGDIADPANGNPFSHSRPCPVVGLSLREGTATLVHKDFAFTESAMQRYIQKYPFGKFFNYSKEGIGINSSDEKSERSETDHSDRNPSASSTGVRKPRKPREKFIPVEFLEVIPNVRTLIFLPLWDPASERWVASGFVWTTQAGRLMSPENELPYLQAFGNSIANEVARLSAQKADRAKTTFIASISHELRSPLHGILGSVEFLREAITSTYQESLVSSIETCGKTLLDTIDHILDHSKVNQLRNTTAKRKQRTEGRSRNAPVENSILGVVSNFDLAQLVEEVCDTVCTGHTFRKTHNISRSAIYDQTENTTANGVTTTGRDNAVLQAKDRPGRDSMSLEAIDIHGSVAVSLIVDPGATWVVRSQPGALRRIVMNLLGNALKYTESGFIAIHMVQTIRTPQSISFCVSVEDSGRGMSVDYQKSKLFMPFSQEDPFSTGTGLGLSIVKQIVESLQGAIEVRSAIGEGTSIKISMQLPTGSSETTPMQDMLAAPRVLRGTSASIICESDTRSISRGLKTKASMLNACIGLGMNISEDSGVETSVAEVDFLLTDSPSLCQLIHRSNADRNGKVPLSVVCVCTDLDEKMAMESRIGRQIEALGWITESVTQPCGPRKLARALLQCQKRVSNHTTERLISRSTSEAVVQQHKNLGPLSSYMYRSLSDAFSQDNSKIYTRSSTTDVPPTSLPYSSTEAPASPIRTESGEFFSPRVLLVDDNAINLKLLVVFAKRQNLAYAEATNGLEALERFKVKAQSTTPATRPFDFVLMDLSMPVMDGLTSTRQIRQFEAKCGLPKSHIVALTGLASAQDQKDASEAGVDMYLVKPVKFADIKRIFEGDVA